jgi:hypothetical protein
VPGKRASVARKKPSRRATVARAKPVAARRRRSTPPDEPEPGALVPSGETVQESLLHIAQDAVVILRHELAKKAELAQKNPGWMSMGDCIALLRLTAELGDAAKRGDGGAQANYDRLSPAEREQLAVLLLKVDYT